MPTTRNAPLAGRGGAFETNFNTASNYYSVKKSFPAYGRQLDQLRKDGCVPVNRVIVSTDWKLGAACARIVVTPDNDPSLLNFSYLAGLSVQIVHHANEADLVRSLIEEIMRIKPRILTVFNFDLAQNNMSGYPAMTLIHPKSLEVFHAN